MDEARADHQRHLVELYRPGLTKAALTESAKRVREAARGLALEGSDVRFMTGIFVPEDEVGLCLFEAGSRDAVEEACRRGGLLFDRILEVTFIAPLGRTAGS